MILVDTSVWADHFNKADEQLVFIGSTGLICTHPFVIGELSVGNLHPWATTVEALRALPSTAVVADDRFYQMINTRKLMGRGLSFVDVHLLASAVEQNLKLWTRDKKLAAIASEIDRAYEP